MEFQNNEHNKRQQGSTGFAVADTALELGGMALAGSPAARNRGEVSSADDACDSDVVDAAGAGAVAGVVAADIGGAVGEHIGETVTEGVIDAVADGAGEVAGTVGSIIGEFIGGIFDA